MKLASRRVLWCGVTEQPDVAWVTQQARNLASEVTESGIEVRFLIHDHDARFAGSADVLLAANGISLIRTPIAAPRTNAHIERQIGSSRRGCLDWILIVNGRHLERVVGE